MKSKIKKREFLIILGIVIVLLSMSINNFTEDIGNNDESIEIKNKTDLKVADSEINIVTPEVKTYTKPMNGYYPAIYGFENDKPGEEPSEWEIYAVGGNGFVEVDDILDGHNRVMEVRKNSGTLDIVRARKKFVSNATEGTVEFWVYKDTDSNTDATRLIIEGEGGRIELGVAEKDLYRRRWVDRVYIATDVFNKNTWYHIRIDFNISEGGWQFWFNDILYGSGYAYPFENSPTQLDTFWISSIYSDGFPSYSTWVDAIGYSWDDNYNIGDNLKEGLLVSFDLNITRDWMGYSLDEQTIKTILGNTTIPMPIDGPHTIQIFGSETGTMYKSDIRNFFVSKFNIITPEDKTYYKPMDGYYPATYGFENDLIGSDPLGWDTHDPSPNIVGITNHMGHNNVLLLSDTSDVDCCIASNTFEPQTSGTIEFYWSSDTAVDAVVTFGPGTSPAIQLMVKYARYYYQYAWGDFWTDTTISAGYNEWHHHRIDFNCITDEWNWTIDGVLIGENLGFVFDSDNIDILKFSTGNALYGYNNWFDAIGYSWDDDYKIGNNLYEGLLLSFDLEITPDWLGYSLDGQGNKTILGNTTIPMPVDGPHTIQIFGNETGTMYKSDIRNFVVSIFNIITPEHKTYYSAMSGYYPATYGFESDEDSMVPYDWTSSQGTVVDSLDGHNKVLEINNTDINIYWVDNTFLQQENGTIEFWLRTTFTGGDPQRIRLIGDSSTIGPDFRIYKDAWEYRIADNWYTMYQKDGITPMLNVSADSWMHVKIEFECGGGAYEGLSPDTYRLIINGMSSEDLDFRYTRNWIDTFSVWSGATKSIIYQIYIDAVGYSWDTYYNIGDNLKEGLLLSFNSEMELDWIAYSLDGQDYVPIVGNTTIPMLAVGAHTIQVFGDVYTSEVRHFIIGTIPPPPPPPGDDDDNKKGEEEIEFLGPTLIIIGISSAIGVIGIAIYFIRKRKLVRE